jgi:hypothetical protein
MGGSWGGLVDIPWMVMKVVSIVAGTREQSGSG